jgi:TonB family protein
MAKPPTVTVELAVDARGRVTDVKTTDIHPKSKLDAVFKEAAVTALKAWRFAPAVEGDAFAPTTVKMQVQFTRPSGAAPDAFSPSLFSFYEEADPYAAAVDRWLARMASEERLQALREIVSAGEAAVDPARRQAFDSPSFSVICEASEPDTAKKIAANLEAVTHTLESSLLPGLTLQPADERLATFVYASQPAFLSLAGSASVPVIGPGFYGGVGILAFHRDVGTSEELLAILLHEATHAFVHRRLTRPGVNLPLWLSEGLAEYVGNSDIEKGKIVLGSHKPFRIYHRPGETFRQKSIATVGANEVKAALRDGRALTVERLLSAPPTKFRDADHAMYYAESWLLVHYLRHGKPEWADREFPSFLLYAAEGFALDDAIARVYGLSGPELEAGFKDYVAAF